MIYVGGCTFLTKLRHYSIKKPNLLVNFKYCKLQTVILSQQHFAESNSQSYCTKKKTSKPQLRRRQLASLKQQSFKSNSNSTQCQFIAIILRVPIMHVYLLHKCFASVHLNSYNMKVKQDCHCNPDPLCIYFQKF